jgi:agmatinase
MGEYEDMELFYTHNPSKFAFSREPESRELKSDFLNPAKQLDGQLNSESNRDKPNKVFGLVGVPFDSTTTYRPGARFGPAKVREASYNFEKYNMAFDCSLDTTFFDFGDVEISPGNFKRTCQKLQETILDLLKMEMIPLVIGGDHSVTYGVLSALNSHQTLDDVTVIHFDAHMDIINTYVEEKFSHATVMRRVFELNPKKIIQLGVRSASAEEMEFIRAEKIEYYKASDVRRDLGLIEHTLSQINGPIYLTVDIDVLDPSFAPSVGTPAPCGISPWHMERLIHILAKKDVIGMDLVEVAADRIGDLTSINAAKIIYDFLSLQD